MSTSAAPTSEAPTSESNCLVCGSDRSQRLYTLQQGSLVRCQQCCLVFYTPRPSAEELAAYYNTAPYRERYKASIMSDQTFAAGRYAELSTILKRYAPALLPPHQKRLLDIGCGVGDLLQAAKAAGWQVTGTEIADRAIAQADATVKNEILLGDILQLRLPANAYDVITSYHVIEHLLNPVEVLSTIYRLLRPGGMALIETPNFGGLGARIRGKHWSHIIPPEHLTYFESGSLRYALKQAGFTTFRILTSSPQVIDSVATLPAGLRPIATTAYRLAPVAGLGAALQAIAFKEALSG